MSMHYNGEQGYGLFLNKEETDIFAHEYAAKEDVDMDIWDITIELGGSYLCDDEYDLRHVWHLDKNLDEMAEEFRTVYGEYFPDNFDYVGHLCHFLGANFG